MTTIQRMARGIIRYSIDGEPANATGNQVRKKLEDGGWAKIGTAAFDAIDIDPADLVATLGEVLELLKAPPGGGVLDHLWIYIDSPDGEDLPGQPEG